MSEKLTIQLKRACNYLDSTGKEIDYVANKQLEYGEPLYLTDLNYLVIGKYRDAYNLYTVKELIDNYLFFSASRDNLSGNRAKYQYLDEDGKKASIPIDTNDNTVANTEFTHNVVNGIAEDIYNMFQSAVSGKGSPSKTLVNLQYDSATKKLTAVFEDIKLNLDNLNGFGPESENLPKEDGEANCGVNDNWSRADHVHPSDSSKANDSEFKSFKTDTENNIEDINIKITPVVNNADLLPVIGYQKDRENLFGYCTNGSVSGSGVYINCQKGVLMGAAWNDFAEWRDCKGNCYAGLVVCENGDGTLSPSTERLQAGANIISDTYGMVIGKQNDCSQPIAVAGRVLVYYIDNNISSLKAGDAVSAGPFGRVIKMTREEIKEYPDRILGYVSEIPTYDEWNGVEVQGRIWIKVK